MNHFFRTILAFVSMVTLIETTACQPEIRLDPTGVPETQRLLPTASTTDAYPPPYNIPTDFPYIPPAPTPISTRTVRPLITPTKTIFATQTVVPSPPGWPTGQPWPPPPPTPAIIPIGSIMPTIFPTPAFPATPTGKMPSSLQKLWYVYAADTDIDPILQMELLDASAQRWGKGQVISDLMLEQGYYVDPGFILSGLYPSPDGRWMVAIVARDVANLAFLIDPTSGKSTRILPDNVFVQFLGWKPDSRSVIVNKESNYPQYPGEVNVITGGYQPIEFPQFHGDLPMVQAIEYSPDGKWMADAIVYPPNRQEGKDYLLSIGLWETQTQARKTIQEIPLAHGIVTNSLVWSSDGNSLAWMSRIKTGNDWSDSNIQTELWTSDRTSGETKAIRVIQGYGVNRGGAEWSPDRKKLAVVNYDESDGSDYIGNIFLVDPISGAETQISHFDKMSVTHLQWSKDGHWIFCNVSDRLSGAIWAVNVTTGRAFPVAGPVITHSPFAFLP